MIKHRFPSLGIYDGVYIPVAGLPWGGSEVSFFTGASPAVANGDIANTSIFTSPDGFPYTLSSTGVPIILSSGSTARQTVPLDVYDMSFRAWYGRVFDYVNDKAPILLDPNAQSFTYPVGAAVDLDLTTYVTDPEGDAITITASGTLPTGLSVVGTSVVGTPVSPGTYTATFHAADFIGQTRDFPAYTFTIQAGGTPGTGQAYAGRIIFPIKLVGATMLLNPPFDFISGMSTTDTIASAVVTATVFSGTDPNPSAIISGSPIISGTVVNQQLTGGISGTIYGLTCAATLSSGAVLTQKGFFAIDPGLVT